MGGRARATGGRGGRRGCSQEEVWPFGRRIQGRAGDATRTRWEVGPIERGMAKRELNPTRQRQTVIGVAMRNGPRRGRGRRRGAAQTAEGPQRYGAEEGWGGGHGEV